jgi:hypothetical protein
LFQWGSGEPAQMLHGRALSNQEVPGAGVH